MHNVKIELNDAELAVQVFHSDHEAVRACELGGEQCQAISKLNNDTIYSFPLTSKLTLLSDANYTLYVKAAFVAKIGKYTSLSQMYERRVSLCQTLAKTECNNGRSHFGRRTSRPSRIIRL